MSKISKQRAKQLKSMGDHEAFLKRIQKTLYYGKLPTTDRLSLPVTEFAAELFSEPRTGRSIDRLHCKDAAFISREACVSPCSFVLAILYLERLKACNPDYLQCVAPSQLFLVALMVSSKFLYDNGEDNEVRMSEWAESGCVSVEELIDLERNFLNAIEWNIFVNDRTFSYEFNHMERILAKRQSHLRGNFTYTELSLLASIDLNILMQFLASIVTVLVATYTAGLLTIIGSFYIASHVPGSSLHRPLERIIEETIDEQPPLNVSTNYNPPLNAVDVLKTGILLASIKYTEPVSDKENVTWEWWTSPTMSWLSETSKLNEILSLNEIYPQFARDFFTDMSIANSKYLDLEDHLHKGTKVRLQDQLEPSWHMEWTETISTFFSYQMFANFMQGVTK